jgi:sugar O-acyltransferase (sialic acid O-acetyltransferase NeuD family)
VARLILLGAGGFGRELLTHAQDCHAAGRLPAVGGYLDDGGAEVLARLGYELPWLGTVDDYVPAPGDQIALGVGSPDAKRAIVGKLKVRGAHFATILHPTALITGRTSIGEGTIMGPFTGSGTDTRIGAYVTVNSYSGFGHDSSVGDFSTLSAHVDIMGYAALGEGVFVGSHASILPSVKVGDGAKISAGAIVYRSVPAGGTVFVPPAKLLKKPS